MSSGSSRECLNLQLIASIPGIDVGIFILISIPPGLLEELSLILGSKLKKQYSPPGARPEQAARVGRRVLIPGRAVAGVFGGSKPDYLSQLCRESCH